jgi:hypothetical protein
MTDMELTITRNVMREHCGMQISCRCGAILDCRRAVELDFFKGDSLVKTAVVCSPCYDALVLHGYKPPEGVTLRAHDGRELFPVTPEPKVAAPVERKPFKADDIAPGMRFRIHHTSGFIVAKVLYIKRLTVRSRDYGAPVIGIKRQFVCVNEKTGREIVVKSAAKFLSLA